MKKIILASLFLIAILLLTKRINAQITLEHTYLAQAGVYGPYLIDIGNNNFKYFTQDVNNNSFTLYNIDHSTYMNVNVPVSFYSGFYAIAYITNTLFDCDSSNIEYAVLRNSPCDTMLVQFRIFRTDGTLLFSKDSATTPYCYGCGSGGFQVNGITNTNAGTKLRLINCNFDYFVYSLCGTLPANVQEPFEESSYVRAYPNPSSLILTFEVDPPDNLYEYKLLIYNSQFQTVKTYVVRGYTKINLATGDWSNDTYFYSLQNNRKVFQSAKFIISK